MISKLLSCKPATNIIYTKQETEVTMQTKIDALLLLLLLPELLPEQNGSDALKRESSELAAIRKNEVSVS
jgi:hypothetical protein